MGRSISYATGSIAVAYRVLENRYGEDYYEEFDYIIEDVREDVKSFYKSFVDCNEWKGHEDHAILENDHAYVGISEYCGLLSIWLLPKTEDYLNTGYSDDVKAANLAQAWCEKVGRKFSERFGEYRKVATFSNGESIYEMV